MLKRDNFDFWQALVNDCPKVETPNTEWFNDDKPPQEEAPKPEPQAAPVEQVQAPAFDVNVLLDKLAALENKLAAIETTNNGGNIQN